MLNTYKLVMGMQLSHPFYNVHTPNVAQNV